MPDKKFIILVDMDDTIEYLLEAWVSVLDMRYGLHVRADDIGDWNVALAFPTLTPEQVYAPLYEDEMWRMVRPIPWAFEALSSLQRDGHEVYITTSSNYLTLRTKMEAVLFRYFPFIQWDHVIVTAKKQMIRGDVMVDDGPHNLIGGDYVRILMDAPHNRSFDAAANGVIRVHNWQEALEVIHGL